MSDLLARCPVCGRRRGRRCVSLSMAGLRGPVGGGPLKAIRDALLARREPHDPRVARSAKIALVCTAVGEIAKEIAA